MKWFLDQYDKYFKYFVVSFGTTLVLTRFIDNSWLLLLIVMSLLPLLMLVEWLLERKNTSLRFPSKDFLIWSVLIYFFARLIDNIWILLAIVIPSIFAFYLARWLLKRKTESEPEEV